jgi:hypothetical protein
VKNDISAKMREHAKQRAKQRYGVEIYGPVRKEIIDMIKNGQAKFISRLSRTRTLFSVVLNDKTTFVIYSAAIHDIVTFLPNKKAEKGERS